MISQSLYGLSIRSNCALPGVTVVEPAGNPDVEVTLGRLPDWMHHRKDRSRFFPARLRDDEQRPSLIVWRYQEKAEFWLIYEDGTQFVVNSEGTRIWTIWPDALTLEDMATYLLGPVFGFLLRLRGRLCLHASGVVMRGSGVAILGPPGAGKSTVAAAFAESGYPVLSDDVLPLIRARNGFQIQPGYPRLRLWPASVRALFGCPDALPPITPSWEKRHLDLTDRRYHFQSQPISLAAIYLLDDRTSEPGAPLVEAMRPRDVFMTLVANTYTNYLLNAEMRAAEFCQLGHLVSQVPVRRARPHSDPARLGQLCKTIVQDFEELSAASSPTLGTDAGQTIHGPDQTYARH